MLNTFGSISAQQSKGTEKTYADTLWLLNYTSTHPNAKISYTASDMILYINSDPSYLSEPQACSRAGGHYLLSDKHPYMKTPPANRPLLNGPIHSISRIMSNVMGFASKAEIGSTYINGQEAVPIRTLLRELGHPQPTMPIQVDNSTADGFANDTIKQKRSKAIDMRFYWIRDRTSQGQFLIYWQPGITNLGDYHTKHHSPAHHQLMRPMYLHTSEELAQCAIAHILRGCVNSRVPKTVRHGTSLHIICLKLLIDLSPIRLESIESSPSRLEPQTSVCRPMAKLFGSIPIRVESQVSVRRPSLKLIGLSHSRLESSASVHRPSLNPFDSSPRCVSFNRRRTG